MWDVLFLPKDECFLLSATAEKPGFVVSSAFETSSKRRLKRAMAAFRKLSDDLERDYHGHVYLVKNVRANPTTLATMYGQYAESFFKLKSELDPTCVFRNKFLDDTFGGMLLCGGAPPTVAAPVTEEREPVAEPRFAPATEEERQEEREAAPER
jgi:hypothetical protein